MSSGAGANSPDGGTMDATGQEPVPSPNCVCSSYRFSVKTTMMERLKAAFGATTNTRKRLEDVKKGSYNEINPALSSVLIFCFSSLSIASVLVVHSLEIEVSFVLVVFHRI
ncbi:MAG TPA: hypothetical protein VK145_03210 [Candidatus Nanoarchaeia archaeon]|nr:hypothetical protein [Candidatus Nanoarchaeia archaeon]